MPKIANIFDSNSNVVSLSSQILSCANVKNPIINEMIEFVIMFKSFYYLICDDNFGVKYYPQQE